ncbi:ABC transporter [Babesia caballi]|uniref:ABC transporter n=1 Tax=Babesia caballi TaxID=5871 RepID=A0AAV4LPR6_BABCB|nr:ABC transporter [Babesia caballi]
MVKEFPVVLPTFAALLASSALISVFPTVVGSYINNFSADNVPSMFTGSCFVAGAALASFLKSTLAGFAGLRISRRLREDFFASLLKRDVGFFDKNSSGKLSSVLSTDAAVSAGIVDHLCQTLRASISFVAGIYFSLNLAPVSLIVYTMLPIVASLLIIFPLSKCVQRHTALRMRRLAALVSHTEERISHIKTVKAFNAENFERGVFADKIRQLFTASFTATVYNGSMNFVAVGAVGSLILLMVNTSATLVLDGTMKIGDVTSLLMYSALVGGSLQSLTSSFAEIRKCLGAAGTLAAYIDSNDVVNMPKGPLASNAPRVEFNHITFAYPSRPDSTVLEDISFVLPAGETLVVFGESGCGKSSIVQLLLGLYEPQSGFISVDGRHLADIDVKELRSMSGWVEQQGALFNDTIRSNVVYGHNKAVDFEDVYKRSGLLDVVNSLPDGDETVVGQLGKALSGGQRQRVSIARLFARNPKLVLLDEVTAALDMDSERQMGQTLAAFLRDKTAIVITHRPNLLSLADYVMSGKICQFGTKSQVMAAPCEQLSNILATV